MVPEREPFGGTAQVPLMVSLNMAMTLDGKVARPDGRWHGISSARDRARMDEIRLRHDAVVAGKNSLLKDNPNLVPRIQGAGGALPRPVLLARRELYPLDRRVFQQERARPLCLLHEGLKSRPVFAGSPPEDLTAYWNELDARADVVWIPGADFVPERLFPRMRESGLRRILLETGPAFNDQVFRADLLDELYITLVPFVFGRNDLPGILDGSQALPGFDQKRWRLADHERIEQEVFLRYVRIRD